MGLGGYHVYVCTCRIRAGPGVGSNCEYDVEAYLRYMMLCKPFQTGPW